MSRPAGTARSEQHGRLWAITVQYSSPDHRTTLMMVLATLVLARGDRRWRRSCSATCVDR